jgi:hypothetical protein
MRLSVIALVTLAAVPAAFAGGGKGGDTTPGTKKDAPALAADELAPGTKALDAISQGSLDIIPLVIAAPPEVDEDMLVLDEAMKKKLVRIHEVDEGGSVNQLRLTNKAKEPVFLLAGEVILGGKQDRIIGRNTIIPAKTTLDVPVFCVEHGRWDENAKVEFKSANALAHGRLRAKASFEDQSEVWDEVKSKNDKRKTTNSTDTYRKVATQQSDGTLGDDRKAVDAALAKLPEKDRGRMVGYAVAINGAVATVDVFGSPKLFRKLEDKLLKSYLTEGVDVKKDKKAKTATVTDVKKFMADADAAAEAESYATTEASTAVKAGKHASKAGVKRKVKPSKDAKPGDAAAAADAPTPEVFMNYSAND